jgi:hypothetical protein
VAVVRCELLADAQAKFFVGLDLDIGIEQEWRVRRELEAGPEVNPLLEEVPRQDRGSTKKVLRF